MNFLNPFVEELEDEIWLYQYDPEEKYNQRTMANRWK